VRAGVIVFPGSNCDHDTFHVLSQIVGADTRFVFHRETDLSDLDLVVLPGGFSYGDYLRAGAIARLSPVIEALHEFAQRGGLVMGICNGFQILCEAGLLPGALAVNTCLEFRCQWVHLRVENAATPFTSSLSPGQVLRIPIAHQEGRYIAPPDLLEELEENGQVVFRYCRPDGSLDLKEREAPYNPNGSLNHIAGIVNRQGNVLGMMPHPERASEKVLSSEDGRAIFMSALAAVGAAR